MKTITATLMSACMALAAGAASAQTTTTNPPVDPMKKPEVTMQECKDHMAMVKSNPNAPKDEARMKKDTACAELMKKQGMSGTGKDPAQKY